jgi:hypothetical protein
MKVQQEFRAEISLGFVGGRLVWIIDIKREMFGDDSAWTVAQAVGETLEGASLIAQGMIKEWAGVT